MVLVLVYTQGYALDCIVLSEVSVDLLIHTSNTSTTDIIRYNPSIVRI